MVEVVATNVLDQLFFTNSEGGVGVCDYREEYEGDRYYLMHIYNYHNMRYAGVFSKVYESRWNLIQFV